MAGRDDKTEEQQQAKRQGLDRQQNGGCREDDESDPFTPAQQIRPF